MCRFAVYLGDEIAISELITEPTNSIIHQSFQSLRREEPLNGDGFGIAWYVPWSERPAIFKDVTPAWSNLNLAELARVTRTRCLFAHVRAATLGFPVQQLNCHPFQSGPFAFMHNGYVAGFAQTRRSHLARLSDEAFAGIGGTTDSEHLFAMFQDHHRRLAGTGAPLSVLADALRAVIADTEEVRVGAGVTEPSQLNLAVTDGHRAVVSRYISHDSELANSLWLHTGGRYGVEGGVGRIDDEGQQGARAVIVASEPLSQDEGWEEVPVNHMVALEAGVEPAVRPI